MKQLVESLFVCVAEFTVLSFVDLFICVMELTVLSVVDPCRDFGNTSMKNGKNYYQFSKFT